MVLPPITAVMVDHCAYFFLLEVTQSYTFHGLLMDCSQFSPQQISLQIVISLHVIGKKKKKRFG